MFDEAVRMFYTKWCESENYKEQSCAENDIYDTHVDEIRCIIGKPAYHNISDGISGLAVEAEYAGFEAGLKYGLLFMQGAQKGGAA